MEEYARVYSSARANVDMALVPPQEAPVEEYSDTSSEGLYVFSSDEDCQAEDAVQHAPWVAREQLPLNMQPQDGAFVETIQYGTSLSNNGSPRADVGRTTEETAQPHLRNNHTGLSDMGIFSSEQRRRSSGAEGLPSVSARPDLRNGLSYD